jgi:hypothetical protein
LKIPIEDKATKPYKTIKLLLWGDKFTVDFTPNSNDINNKNKVRQKEEEQLSKT